MKMRIWNLFALTIMVGIITFSLIQLRTTVVKADGCPSDSAASFALNCDCRYFYSTTEWTPQGPLTHCYYNCSCYSGGSGEPFEIEREITVEN